MMNLKCNTCGGELIVDRSGRLICTYCGNETFFNDHDLREYRVFRDRMMSFLKSAADASVDTESHISNLWDITMKEELETKEGDPIEIRYIHKAEEDGIIVYTTRGSVLYVFPPSSELMSDIMLQRLSLIEYPSADVKELDRCFPKFTGKFTLSDGSIMLAFERRENVFPLALFENLDPDQTAWIVSRLENICCVLEFSDLVHRRITKTSVFIDPFSHEAVLYGGWWKCIKKLYPIRGPHPDLQAVRDIADQLLGTYRKKIPMEFELFLREKPAADAFADFTKWDTVIEKGFGGRRFAKMDVRI